MPEIAAAPLPVQQGLRATGYYLDTHACRLASLSVISDGVALTLAVHDVRAAGAALVFTHDDLVALTAQAHAQRGAGTAPGRPDPLVPTGYEDLLRTLGMLAAQYQWTGLRLARLGTTLLLHYGTSADRGALLLQDGDVHQLLNAAFRQRGTRGVAHERDTIPDGTMSGRRKLARGGLWLARGVPPLHVPRARLPEEGDQRGCLPYAVVLDALGYSVEQAQGTDVLVHELEGGVLVTFMGATEQQVVTFTWAEVAGLHAVATQEDRRQQRAWHGLTALLQGRWSIPTERPSVRARLRALGQDLDRRGATAILLQEHAASYHVEFTGLADDGWGRTLGLIRLTDEVDHAYLEARVSRTQRA
jgi:hypothetical protein